MVFGFLKKKKEEKGGTAETEKGPPNPRIHVPLLDEEAKEKLKKARIMIVGCGTAGEAAAVSLAASGAGNAGLADNKYVESDSGNPIFAASAGRRKSIILADYMKEINPEINVVPSTARLRYDNAPNVLRNYNIIVDCSNDKATHYLISDACALLEKKCIIALPNGTAVLDPKEGPCYRCIGEMRADHRENAAADGTTAAKAAINLALEKSSAGVMVGEGENESLIGKDPECPTCGKRAVTQLIDYEKWLGIKKAPESAAVIFNDGNEKEVKAAADTPLEISPEDVKKKIDAGEELMLVDVREPWEYDIAKIEGSNLIPLGELSEHLEKLPKNILIVMYCHHGNRSMVAAEMLFAAGFNVKSMKGGIDEWSRTVDIKVPAYSKPTK